jgi:hypothetical protein
MDVEYKKFVPKRCFGIEIEVGNEVPISTIKETISCNSVVPVKTSYYRASLNNTFWEVKHDGSCGKNVDKFGINEGGFEVTTFKGSTTKELLHICNMARKIKQIGCCVNKNCGLHVHVDISDFDLEKVGKLIAYWLCIEKTMFQAVPSVRKNNKFCNSLSTLRPKYDCTDITAMRVWNHYKPYSTKLHDNFDRRCALNLVNYYRSLHIKNFKRPTVEFRFPEGTLVSRTIKNWTRIFINFVNNVANKEFDLKELKNFNLEQTLNILGLGGNNDKFFLLSPGLYESKIWLLRRIVKYATYPYHDLIPQARKMLQSMEALNVHG